MSPGTKEIITMRNLFKSYRTGRLEVPVLKGITMSVCEGEFAGIMGSSGSGKSTLLNILGLLDVPDEGEYLLQGSEVSKMSDSELSTMRNIHIGFIFQSFNLFTHLNVEQNIETPMIYADAPKKYRRERARELASLVGLSHRLDHRPNELSGGECQRVAIARSLANKPSFLLADEPTGNLDEKTGNEIMKLFHELNEKQNLTVLMVTHNPVFEPEFHKVIRLRDGRVVSDYTNASNSVASV